MGPERLLGLLVALTLAPATAAPYRHQPLRFNGVVREVLDVDLDGDGRRELLVVHAQDDLEGGRRLTRIELPAAGPPRLTELEIPATATAFSTLARAPGDARALVFLAPEAVYLHEPDGGRTRLDAPGFFEHALRGELPHREAAGDVDGDGLEDLLVPGREGFLLLRQRPDRGFDAPVAVGPAVERSLARDAWHQAPEWFFWLRRGLPDVVSLHAGGPRAMVWRGEAGLVARVYGPEGALEPDPRDFLKLAGPARPGAARGEAQRVAEDDDRFEHQELVLDDIQGDGLEDVIVAAVHGRLGSLSGSYTQFAFHPGLAPGRVSSAPTQIIKVPGISHAPALVDLDGDGALDLLVSSLRTDLWTQVKQVVLRSVRISYLGFLYHQGHFSRGAAFRRDTDLDLKALEAQGSVPVLDFRGDFDGDRRRDCLALDRPGRLRVLRGRADDSWFADTPLTFDDEPLLKLEMPIAHRRRVVDLDGDGRSDVIFQFEPEAPERFQVHLLLSWGGH